eukprot:TRINITY_DN10756_c0_g1_i1.p1 TRINITY_DN10756_c0_g1~~TRINITY_DN10756_c0_g1_i1.p1  ORF type:complete len:1638 (-),score=635.61 TRINITY_DN10756_c0_g1_i1:838-5751(-)
MVRKSVRNFKCKNSSVVVVEPGKRTPPKKFLKVRNFKDLQAEEVKLEENLDTAPATMGCGSADNMETEKMSGRKRSATDDLITVEASSDPKKVKLEIKVELTEDSPAPARFIPSTHKAGPGTSSTPKLSSVQVLGHDLYYRHHGSMVLFKTSSVMDMLSKSLPLMNPSQLESVVDRSGGQKALFFEDTWKRAFISWNALRVILNGGLLDLAIRDLLLSVRVVGDYESDNQENQVSRCNSILDSLVINKIEVKFKVRSCTVYLEVLSAFTSLDRLHEAMEGSWSKVDQLLASHGLSQKAAFKKRGAGKSGAGGLSRNYMTLQAYSIISQGHRAKDRVESLVMMVDKLKEKEQSICKEIQQTVDMILRTSCIAPGEKSASLSPGEESQLGHKYCGNSLCGRGYHFVMRCCGKSHVLRLGGQEIGYVRKQGRIFLEKCAAFGALGRMYVIRCSDYRKTDKMLLEKGEGETVESNFLFEHDDANLGRNRRTHISLDAFITLVNAGFADPCKTDILVSCMEKVRREYQDSKRDSCEEMEIIDLSGSDVEEVDDQTKRNNTEESSSGIDSEDFSPMTPRKIFKSAEHDSDGELDNDVGEFVQVLGTRIPTKTVDNKVFMEKTSILKLVESPSLLQKGYRVIDKLLEENNVCLDEAFLYEGRQRGFISSSALKIVLKSDLLQEFEQRAELLQEITKLEKNPDLLKESQILVLKSFDNIRFRVVSGTVHLDSQKLLKLAGFSSSYVYQAPSKANLLLCKILSDRGVNTQNCFFKHGKSKYAFISLPAAHTLLRSEIGPLKDGDRTRRLTEEIFDALKKQGIIKSVPDVLEKGIKVSEEFPIIKYKVEGGKLFLHRKTCFECLGLESAVLSSKKGYSAINNILLLGGLDLTSCYIATKQQKYSYISCLALVHLLQSRDPVMVCLRNKEQFLAGLLAALQAGALSVHGLQGEGQAVLQLAGEGEDLDYKCQEGRMFLHRHSAYTLAGLYEQADWTEQDIYEDPTGPLVERGVDPVTAFIADGGDRFAWLSLHSLFVLMGCGPGLGEGVGNCYQTVAWRDLLSAVALQEPRLRNHIKMETFKTVLLEKVMDLYIQFIENDSEAGASTSGNIDLIDSESGVDSGTDSVGLVAVEEIIEILDDDNTAEKVTIAENVEQLKVEIEVSMPASDHPLSPTAPVPAISISDPLPSLTCHETLDPHLSLDQQVPHSAPVSPMTHSTFHSPSTSAAPSPSTSCLPSPTCSLPDETWSTTPPQFSSLTPARYTKLQADILAAASGVGGHIGDWEVSESDQEVTRLSVRPGYGASRKGSFLHPDYAAILRYTLILAPGLCSLTINEHEINSTVLDIILDRGEKEGTLSFLYQLISLRPCFGSFSPELVETLSRSLDKQDKSKQLGQLYIDSNFIGTSSSGRTYAGTVRDKDCDFLAGDRVSDCCNHCKKLDKLTINRSVLGQEEEGEEVVEDNAEKAEVEGGKTSQKSVWQLATTSEDGCSFLCPQVQSFNTSLPHAFDGSSQATTIVNHRVEISNNLKVQVELCERSVSRSFPEFQKSRQLGPLLDWVAGLRLCVGYPNMQLVKQATFIIQNMDRLKPELRKLFKFLAVDDKFGYQSEKGDGVGTIRAGSCLVAAEPGADICHQCRLLQEPIEFLAV